MVPDAAIVELRDVTFGYGAEPVLEGVSFRLHGGQFAALVGPSGAGKTTLLKLILGTLHPTRREIIATRRTLNGPAALRIDYVPQLESMDWNFPVTAEQVVLMGRVRRSGRLGWAGPAAKINGGWRR